MMRSLSITLFMFVLFSCFLIGSSSSLATGTGGYWQQTKFSTALAGETENTENTVSESSASVITKAPWVGDVFKSTATWSQPPAICYPNEPVKLVLTVKIDEYTYNGKNDGYIHNGLNSADNLINATIDVEGLAPGSGTASRVKFLTEDGRYYAKCIGANGVQTVPSDTMVGFAKFPSGYTAGQKLAIYIFSRAGNAVYLYEWVNPEEQPQTGIPDASGGSIAPLTPGTKIEVDYELLIGECEGEVIIQFENGEEEPVVDFFGSKRVEIPRGATIKTGGDSYVTFHLYPGSVYESGKTEFTLGPRSSVKLAKQEEAKGLWSTNSGILLMNIKNNLNQMITEGTLDVTMNQAVAGRKGTIAVFIETEGVSTVKVLEGKITFTSKSTGKTIDVLPGETVSADKNGLSEVTKFIIEDELENLGKTISKKYAAGIKQAVNDAKESSGLLAGVLWVVFGFFLAGLVCVVLYIYFKRKKNTPM